MTDQAQARIEAMCASIREALEQGITYDDPLCTRVSEQCEAIDEVRENFLGTFERPMLLQEQQAFMKDLSARVAAGPRGTWAIMRCPQQHDGRVWYKFMISDGSGKPTSLGSTSYEEPPSFAHAFRRMYSFEVYSLRKDVVEPVLKRDRSLAAIDEYGIEVGDVYRNVDRFYIRAATRATVRAIDRDTGQVTVEITCRGKAAATRVVTGDALVHAASLQKLPTVTAADLAEIAAIPAAPRR